MSGCHSWLSWSSTCAAINSYGNIDGIMIKIGLDDGAICAEESRHIFMSIRYVMLRISSSVGAVCVGVDGCFVIGWILLLV